MLRNSKIFVAGHNGLVGSAIVRKLQAERCSQIITRSRKDLDLTDQRSVRQFFEVERPDYVILAAAKVGGIIANSTYPADFIRENLLIETNVIDAAYRNATKKLIFLGSSCIYPKFAPQPLKEEYLLTSELEPTNDAYAVAKIAGVKMCEAYRRQHGFDSICIMPTNLYGPNDNFNLETSHVFPALLRKFHEAKMEGRSTVEIWGTGEPYREFLYVEDFTDACYFLMNKSSKDIERIAPDGMINVGSGRDITIRSLANMIAETVGYEGELQFDTTKPDGTPRKLLDVSRMESLGWKAKTNLKTGIRKTYEWFGNNIAQPESITQKHKVQTTQLAPALAA